MPIILVTLGMGASVVALTSSAPFLIVLSQHKVWVFAGEVHILLGVDGMSCP
jgi:hypothetical protein